MPVYAILVVVHRIRGGLLWAILFVGLFGASQGWSLDSESIRRFTEGLDFSGQVKPDTYLGGVFQDGFKFSRW